MGTFTLWSLFFCFVFIIGCSQSQAEEGIVDYENFPVAPPAFPGTPFIFKFQEFNNKNFCLAGRGRHRCHHKKRKELLDAKDEQFLVGHLRKNRAGQRPGKPTAGDIILDKLMDIPGYLVNKAVPYIAGFLTALSQVGAKRKSFLPSDSMQSETISQVMLDEFKKYIKSEIKGLQYDFQGIDLNNLQGNVVCKTVLLNSDQN